ncbi:bifunctional tRNA (5-methylaminomethyl-2-thiouridine)(34)-methyltransferase MnmD/FAD-dependent 5-carboxymethylaminomethyl-2-thiouridine(34) oxidoreductase MnmC [Pseudohongiella sp.]|uniref:MnmC-like methyltransferase domain-containing protein n=1 Tax=marine sediment metagenome TaxID=412755 RepID=A0A0F9Z3C8_9ZZZZ|nr:bifunctional tRNA (5-methylaminomethyl-2-thiouridine)(34)-methyltransferase MnmD/FAD-dependent 5-carboxymethylaminomethyl-2-thiouridine(34) oxidoreductase MnmC [Pseudohongiella sp.]HDZ09101.1 bifunctional tRNA (5-methylaminomethyl-2-thiouridine)(34)-methyltransferase MnmD/FAD-dependent 5-carboxymethylaminomethyl-2-thiouridine(34) oxidoreductase MnmC [Pseudohongiella sp.]HEA63563.1 bifunctional tRNA (5-methylaminomethyl-2-thiouridine)(34)-methyltransferase MnmD/FAD-dependent 5-carboxymethylamin
MTQPSDIQNAHITWQDDGAPFSPDYDDVYFSRQGGLAETEHVFLRANDLQARWLAAEQQVNPGVFTVAELGFGTGLNFLSCWRLWQQTGCQRLRLHFISCEKHPLSHAALQQALLQWPELADLSSELLAHYPDHSGGYHRLILRANDDRAPAILLDLYYGDALALLQQQCSPGAGVDAWFLDGFTPAHNPELWSQDILDCIAGLSRTGTTLSSYSVTGRVVRALRELNFAVEKRQGFGNKRQMLFARKAGDDDTLDGTPDGTPDAQRRQSAVVIGAGLAGATAARALAGRGVTVTVLEQLADIAQGASGNSQAVVQMRLNKQADTHWQFHLHSYLYALRYYEDLARISNNAIDWHSCGVLTLDSAYTNTRHQSGKAAATVDGAVYSHYPTQLLHKVSAAQTQAISGIRLPEDGYLQPRGGWLNPAATCRVCLDHPLITVRRGIRVVAIENHNGRWQTLDDQHRQLTDSDILIVANSYAARDFRQTASYPVSPLRGQITEVPASSQSSDLKMVVCSERYLAPLSSNGQHCIGASYVKGSVGTELTAEEQVGNLEKSALVRDQLALDAPAELRGRASIRGSSGDYMPIAGSVPDPDLPETRYGGTQHLPPHDPAKTLTDPAPLPGLYITTGHGSHGTASCPVLAEHIACLAVGEASPLPLALAECVSPIRFIRRQRRRQHNQAKR